MGTFADRLRERNAQQAALTPAAVAALTPSTPPPPATAASVYIRTRLAAASNGASVAPPPYTPPVAATAPAPATAPVPSDTPRRGRGRARAAAPTPTATEVIETVGTAVGQAAVESAAPTPDAFTSVVPAPAQPIDFTKYIGMGDGYQLYVNCCPIGEPVILFSHYAREVLATLAEAMQLPHYGLAPYGEGKAKFQDALQQYLQQSPPAGKLVVDSRTDEGRDALPILERFAIGNPTRGF